jgi:arylsulfatase A-like enzyme
LRIRAYKNTIIVLWGDHGWKLGEHGMWCKHTNFELDTHVPLILKVPGQEPDKTDNFVELLDLYPTLVDLWDFVPTKGPLFQKNRNQVRNALSIYPHNKDDADKLVWVIVSAPLQV